MFHVLNDDEVVKVFLFLFICSDRDEPFNLVQTCKRFSEMFGVWANGIGSAHYKNFVHSKKVRCSSIAEKADKVLNLGFTRQLEMETPFHRIIQSFMKADSVNAMHCSSTCCERSRKAFNNNGNMQYKLVEMLPSVRCVCTATSPGGHQVEFSMYTAFEGQCFLSKTIRDKASGATLCQQTLNETHSPFLDRLVHSISCSPCGRHLIYWRSEPVDNCLHWDTLFNDRDVEVVNELDLQLSYQQLCIPFQNAFIKPLKIWWPDDSTMLIAWNVISDGTANDALEIQSGIVITAQDVHWLNQRLVMPFQYGNPMNLSFSGWYVIKGRTYMDRKSSILVYDFSAGPNDIKTLCVSCLDEDNSLLGRASHELFSGLARPCISQNGSKLAILAYTCEHEYKQRPAKPRDTRLVDDHMIMVLFTRSADGNFYYRQNGHNDECFLPIKTAVQGVTNFVLGFSPCESIVHVIYTGNKFNTPNDAYAYPSAYFVRIDNKQIRRTMPVMNTKVRELCWDYKGSLTVLPKHGAVRLVPKE